MIENGLKISIENEADIKQDLELLALLNSLNAEIKHSLKAVIKSIIAKGAKNDK